MVFGIDEAPAARLSCYRRRVDSTPGAKRSADGTADSTADPAYAERLRRLERRGVKRFVDVQAPYRWNLQRLRLGRVLDVGCGLGRNLAHLGPDSVGVDHNADSIRIARDRGFTAFTVEEFAKSPFATPGSFDGLLYAHVLEHMDRASGLRLLQTYLPYLTATGRICMITPQQRGYASDPTHVRYIDLDELRSLVHDLGWQVERAFSYPFPRTFGRLFTYNEFVMVARR